MSKFLIEESPLTFQPSLAVAIGLNEAIVLQQIHYWINNVKNKGYEQDGYKWVYNTYADWKETNFPFWSENTIQRIFASLEEKGLVISIQPMKSKYDRTKYYRIDHTKLEAFDDPKLVSSLNESEITAENTTDSFFTAEENAQNEAKMKAILEAERQAQEAQNAGKAWRGRELLAPEHLVYGDWYHAVTGWQMYGAKAKPKRDSTAMNEFKTWWENDLTIETLKAAYDVENEWRKAKSGLPQNITHPRELTAKAKALQVAPVKPAQITHRSERLERDL